MKVVGKRSGEPIVTEFGTIRIGALGGFSRLA